MKVLLIVKFTDFRNALAGFLKMHNYTIVAQCNGWDAETLYKHYQPDLTITNLSLSDEYSGFDIIKKIRSINPTAKVVGMSQFYDDEYKAELKALHANAYITQDIDPNLLLEALQLVVIDKEYWQENKKQNTWVRFVR